ncbi:hypothetical protein PMAYCL1PPCAC_15804, partial [Pristionchus mayeri]
LAILTVLLPEAFGVTQRGFYCNDRSIQHPFHDHTIPMGHLTIASLALFLVIPLIVEFLVARVDSSVVSYHLRKSFTLPSFVVRALIIFGYANIGLVMQVALTQYAKYGAGRLRPHFMDVCKPVGYKCATPNDYIVNYTCSGDNAFRIYETRLSFFSGHSSTAIYTALIMAIYLESRLAPRYRSAGIRRAVQILLVISALIVCVSRVTDNFHHPTDVLVGIIFGAVMSVFTASKLAGLCTYNLTPIREPKGRATFARFVT